MKRLSSSCSSNSSDSHLLPLPAFPAGEDYFGDDGDDGMLLGSGGNGCGSGEKKRRLSTDQVRALERSFEVENKLEPERKAKLARDLGLQPRQVAVWFQNRRARWKTKQLERDYTALRSSYDALRLDHDALLRDKDALAAEIKELKAKLGEQQQHEAVSFSSVKEEPMGSGLDVLTPPVVSLTYKDGSSGSSESDSSAVLNEPREAAVVDATAAKEPILGPDATSVHKSSELLFHGFGHGFLKVEEDEEILGGVHCCGGFFSDEQPPSLAWYYEEQWTL